MSKSENEQIKSANIIRSRRVLGLLFRSNRIAMLAVIPALVVAFGCLFIYGKSQHDFTATISYAHFLTKAIEVYVQDHHDYPESLQALCNAEGGGGNLAQPPFGSSVRYQRPSTNSPDKTPIIVVTFHNRQIVVTKDFTRTP